MSQSKDRAVIDTNLAITANGKAPQASRNCQRECIAFLIDLMSHKRIVLDDDWNIIREYKNNLNESGQPGTGDAFLLWVLQNRRNPEVSELVHITPDPDRPLNFLEFPSDPALDRFDDSDRKFVAVAVVSNTPVWNAVDSDWWLFYNALQRNGVQVVCICPDQKP
jgi:hypothetical protein